MKTQNTAKVLLAGAAIAGLLGGTTARLHAAQTNTNSGSNMTAGVMADDSDKGKHACKGANTCKGQGGCKSGDNGCKGKNTCKGKGGCATDGSKS